MIIAAVQRKSHTFDRSSTREAGGLRQGRGGARRKEDMGAEARHWPESGEPDWSLALTCPLCQLSSTPPCSRVPGSWSPASGAEGDCYPCAYPCAPSALFLPPGGGLLPHSRALGPLIRSFVLSLAVGLVDRFWQGCTLHDS